MVVSSGQFIAHRQQALDFIIRHPAVQGNADPGLLVHMVCRIEAWPTAKGAYQNRITLHIQHIQDTFTGAAQLTDGNLQDQGVPLPAVLVPENRIPVVPRVVRLCSVSVLYPFI